MTATKFSDSSPQMIALERLYSAIQIRDRCKKEWAQRHWNLVIKRLERQAKYA